VQLVRANPVIEAVLTRYESDLGAESVMYRNHVYRGFNLHLSLSGLRESDALALAWVSHDLGLWTARTLDYLGPSVRLAEELAPEFKIETTPQLRLMIEYHHCLRPLQDPLAEGFRKADRADAWPRRWGSFVAPVQYDELTEAFPYCGFHQFLGRTAVRYALTHPWRPLPMFRWRGPDSAGSGFPAEPAQR